MYEDGHWPTPCPSDVDIRPFGTVNGLGLKSRGQRGLLGATEDRRENKNCKHDTMPGHRFSETSFTFLSGGNRRLGLWRPILRALTERCTKHVAPGGGLNCSWHKRGNEYADLPLVSLHSRA